MYKKLYNVTRSCCFLLLISTPAACFSDTPAPQIPPSATAAQSGQVAISASQKQLVQIKALFDQADYPHLENPANVVGSLLLAE
jgi:hypothetical protein